jgi:1-deoxy-D-xylulose-5-phosphate synthase
VVCYRYPRGSGFGLEKLNEVYGTNLAAMPSKGVNLPIGKGRVVRSARAGASQRAAILSIGARLVPACEVKTINTCTVTAAIVVILAY